MPEPVYPTVNGWSPSWSNIVIVFQVDSGESVTAVDIAGIKFSSKLERTKQKGASGGRTIRRTTGTKTETAAATFYRHGLIKLKEALITKAEELGYVRGNVVQYGLVVFDILVQFEMPGNDGEIFEHKLKGLTMIGEDFSYAEGADPDKPEIEFDPMDIVEIINGKEASIL